MPRLHCEICIENFSTSKKARQPYVGCCGHTFCYSCTTRLNGTCPRCRRGYNPQKNFTLIESLENTKNMNKKFKQAGFNLEENDDGSDDSDDEEGAAATKKVKKTVVKKNTEEERTVRQEEGVHLNRGCPRPLTVLEVYRENEMEINRRIDHVIGGIPELRESFERFSSLKKMREDFHRTARRMGRERLPFIFEDYFNGIERDIKRAVHRAIGNSHELYDLSGALTTIRKERNNYMEFVQWREIQMQPQLLQPHATFNQQLHQLVETGFQANHVASQLFSPMDSQQAPETIQQLHATHRPTPFPPRVVTPRAADSMTADVNIPVFQNVQEIQNQEAWAQMNDYYRRLFGYPEA